ncbi:hypothetical protein C8J57DRAFT_742854 [Mycena rebaudengoi]|nr:hypothetical protein C8J57DRAFT_742854 [Mycena rebaudengoi]
MNPNAPIKQEPQSVDYRFPPTPPSSESGWTSSDWSQRSSPVQSPVLPSLSSSRLARSVRGTERQREQFISSRYEDDTSSASSSYYRSPIEPPSPPEFPSAVKSKHIPRPPNAFILYRSDFLKRGIIPADVERRQQNLSRVAGQCWNMLPAEEKMEWQAKAAERSARHQREYPNYHFKPSPRGKGKAKIRAGEDKGEDRIRALREKYAHVAGPSVPAPRQRKAKTQQGLKPTVDIPGGSDRSMLSDPPLSTPSSLVPQDLSPYYWPNFLGSSSSSPSLPSPEPAAAGPALPPCFPQHTFPHFAPRRPSTSLGFVRRAGDDKSCFQHAYGPERPASAASDTNLAGLVRDFNITPTVANFRNISMPPTPSVPYTFSGDPNDLIRAPLPFHTPGPHFPVSFPGMSLAATGELNDGTAFSAPFSNLMSSLDGPYSFGNDDNSPFSLENWSFDTAYLHHTEMSQDQ